MSLVWSAQFLCCILYSSRGGLPFLMLNTQLHSINIDVLLFQGLNIIVQQVKQTFKPNYLLICGDFPTVV